MTQPDEQLDPSVMVRAAVDVLVFAPLGLGAKLVEDAPGAVGRARRELSNARFLGRMAVDQGIKQVRSRIDTTPTVTTPTASPRDAARVDIEPAAADDLEVADDRSGIETTAADLALPDYDTLPAIDIVAKLETLSGADRAAIERYETVNRQRRTVLGKLAQLAEQ